MNILVGSNNLKSTGLGTYNYTQVIELISRGHDVDVVTLFRGKISEQLSSNMIELDEIKNSYDLILLSQNDITEELIKRNVSGHKIFTVHGLAFLWNDIPNEQTLSYVDNVVSISKEIKQYLKGKNIESTVVNQPVDCRRFTPIDLPRWGKGNIKVISMVRGYESEILVRSACEMIGYEYMGTQKPVEYEFHDNDEDNVIFKVEDKIREADIVVGLGRCVYETLSCGRNALVFDDRDYQGNLGDGMVTPSNIDDLNIYNFSGRFSNKSLRVEDLVRELKKYNPEYGSFFRDWILENCNVVDTIDQYLLMRK